MPKMRIITDVVCFSAEISGSRMNIDYMDYILSGPQGSWFLCCLHLEKRVPLGGVSGVASFISVKNSFNKTEAAVFSCRLCFLRAFPFISLYIGCISKELKLFQACFQLLNKLKVFLNTMNMKMNVKNEWICHREWVSQTFIQCLWLYPGTTDVTFL